MSVNVFSQKVLLASLFVWLAAVGVCLGETIFLDDFSSDLGWTGYVAGEWARGPAVAATSCSNGEDPASDHSGTSDNYLLGYVIGGCYAHSMPAKAITSPVIDCSGKTGVYVKFYRILGVERSAYDQASVEIFNGTSWTEIFHNPDTSLDETAWSMQSYDVSAAANNNPNFQIRFTIGPSDSSVNGCGWNIDDLEVYTLDPLCVSVEPASSSGAGMDGSIVAHSLVVTNCGTDSNTIGLSVADNEWTTTITDSGGTEISQIVLASMASQTILVNVLVGSEWLDDCIFTASSLTNATSVDVAIHTVRVAYFEDFASDPFAAGWTGYAADEWEWGPATASSGCSGTQDPSVDHSPTSDNNLLGYNIGGCYTSSMAVKYVTSPPIDMSGLVAVQLNFWRMLGVESASYDHATVEVSRNGVDWVTVWSHVGGSFSDTSWTNITYDLDGYLDGQSAAQFRFSMGPTDSSVTYAGWNIDDVSLLGSPAAFLEGTVSDALGPIENAHVLLDGTNYEAYTNSSGFYHIEAPIGTYSATVSAVGHNDGYATGIVLEEGMTTIQDFVLTYPDITVDPGSLEITINIAATDTRDITITNEGNGDLEFNTRIEYLTNRDLWDIVADIDCTTPSTDDQILCGEVIDGKLWIAGGGGTAGSLPNSLHRFDLDGTYVDTISQGTSSDWGYFDLTSDGSYLYGADANGIYQVDPATGAGTLLFANPVSNWPLGIAYKSDTDTFIIHAWFDAEYVEVNRSGAIQRTFNIPLSGMFGLAYDTYTDGGPYLWIFDQTATVTPASVIYQADISTPGSEALTGFTFNLPMLGGLSDQLAGGLFLTTEWVSGKLILGGVVQGTPNDKAFALDFGSLSSWLSIDPTSGTVPPPPDTNTQVLEVLFDSHEVDGPGDYQASIMINSNDGDEASVTVPVMMHVIAPFWATIDPIYQEGGAEAEFSAAYTVTINNIGEQDDTYDLAVVSSDWTMTFPGGTSVFVAAGNSADFQIEVAVPAGTLPGVTSLGTFSVTSQGAPLMALTGQVLTTCSVSIGSISGSVTHDGAIAIQGALVEVIGTGLSGTSDEDGVYLIENVPVGLHTVTCSAVGYNPVTFLNIEVQWHETTQLDFDLVYPDIAVNPLVINHQMDPDQTATLEDAVIINNNGSGYLDYTIEVETMDKKDRELMILLVSDPTDGTTTSENYDSVYQAAITSAGYTATLWDHDTQGSPTLTDLEPYDIVIWYTGISQGNAASDATLGHSAISLAEEATLVSWLNLGGKSLCLSGMWIAWNCIADANSETQMASTLFDDYIQLNYPAENFGSWIIVDDTWTLPGQGGPIGGTETWPVAWVSAENYPDQLEPNAGGEAIFSWNDSGTTHHQAGIQYDGGTFRTVLLACPIEHIGTTADKTLLMNRMIEWFAELASTWLEVDPTEGQILAGANQPLELMFDTTGMVEGYYQAHINIQSNDGDQPQVTVEVNLTVGNVETPTPPPPTSTPGGPTNTPTNTQLPPTYTQVPPTNTVVPATNTPTPTITSQPSDTPTEIPSSPTPPPPTATSTSEIPPTNTPVPPSETPVQPTETPACTVDGLDLVMPEDTIFTEGDICYLIAEYCNTGESPIEDGVLFVILEVEGVYWFYPSWSLAVDYEIMTFPSGLTSIDVIAEFTWPETFSNQSGAVFYGAVTNPDMNEILGGYDILTFGWSAS